MALLLQEIVSSPSEDMVLGRDVFEKERGQMRFFRIGRPRTWAGVPSESQKWGFAFGAVDGSCSGRHKNTKAKSDHAVESSLGPILRKRLRIYTSLLFGDVGIFVRSYIIVTSLCKIEVLVSWLSGHNLVRQWAIEPKCRLS